MFYLAEQPEERMSPHPYNYVRISVAVLNRLYFLFIVSTAAPLHFSLKERYKYLILMCQH